MNDEEILLDAADARVRIIELPERDATPWHHHSEVTDHCFCLTGHIEVQFHGPEERVPLPPGGRCTVAVGRVHRVVNAGRGSVRYLLVQAGGRYDFVRSAP